jgi:beta-aspartyl-peptidase (threonine type)
MNKNLYLFFIATFFTITSIVSCSKKEKNSNEVVLKPESIRSEDQGQIVLIIHGGASYHTPARNNPVRDSLIKSGMKQALLAGRAIITKGGSSTDAVQAAIRILEDSPYFNAGKGAVFSSEGFNELDASLMEGKDLKAGAVAAVRTIKNPIDAARLVIDSSDNVMLVGKGAEQFAALKGAKIVEPSYFFSQDSWDELLKAKMEKNEKMPSKPIQKNQKFGTVGAVALDKNKNISAGTSTGGRNNKRFGRIGDSPIIGASTYADNRYCGVSSTGWGEYFIRNAVAHSVVSYLEFKQSGVAEAAQYVIYQKMKGIEGGIVALDKNGNGSFPFNTPVMNRGYITLTGEPQVFIYK